MKTTNRQNVLGQIAWASIFTVGICVMLISYTMAGPVVQSTSEDEPQDAISGTSPGFSYYPWSTPQEDEKNKKSTSTSTVPPSSGSSSSSSSGGQQQQAPMVQSTPQAMPLPPTYAPGAPGAPSGSDLNPYGEMPLPPTAYGLYDSPNPGMTSPAPGMRPGMGSMPQQSSTPTGGSRAAGGYTGYGAPPAPTPTSSLGGAAFADPRFGRYEAQNIQRATAPRQPATFGQSQSRILNRDKPFSAYRPARATSPYMRLTGDFRPTTNPASNNYYEYVKPLLDQEAENRRVNTHLQGLTDTARSGYQTLESMKQRPGNTIQSAAPRNPATFMNTGQYYPGFAR